VVCNPRTPANSKVNLGLKPSWFHLVTNPHYANSPNKRFVGNVDGNTLKPIIREKVKAGTTIITDSFGAYYGLNKDYNHEIVNHLKGEYVRDGFHTNSLEGFWSQLKRGIYGVYHQVSPKHLHRYCDEFSFRYNTRAFGEGERFNTALKQADSRLKYDDLIAK